MAASTVPKLYRSVIEEVLNSVRETFLDDGVDEQILQDIKQTWERKLNESKAVDANARDPETVPATKTNTRNNNSAARNAQHNRDANREHQNAHHQQQSQTHQQHQQPQNAPAQQSHSQMANHHHPMTINPTLNHTATASLTPQMAIHHPGNLFQSPSGVIYTTANDNNSEGQKIVQPQKFVFLQSATPGQNMIVASPGTGGTINLPHDIMSQLMAHSNNSVITQAQPTVLHHTSNVAQTPGTTIQFASNQRQTQPANPRPPQPNSGRVVQLDGADDSSDDDDDEDEYRDNDDDHDDNDDEVNDEENEGQGEDEEPLNSEDDVSDEDPTELFDTDNVVVCQYDKITRSRNKWKFHLKDGIMNLQGKDYVFQRAIGDAEW